VSGAAVTVKPAVSVPVPVSGLVTTTSRGPAVAAAPIERLAVSCVGETTVCAVTVTPTPKDTVAPAWKVSPARVTETELPCAPRAGVTLVTAGFTVPGGGGCAGDCTTSNPPANPLDCPSRLVTVTVRTPTVAVSATATLAVSCVADTTATALTVTPLPKDTVAPDWKFVPRDRD